MMDSTRSDFQQNIARVRAQIAELVERDDCNLKEALLAEAIDWMADAAVEVEERVPDRTEPASMTLSGGSDRPRRDENMVVGAVWRAKRAPSRCVYLISRFTTWDGRDMFQVRRNTSRRRQALRVETLLKDYRYSHMAAD